MEVNPVGVIIRSFFGDWLAWQPRKQVDWLDFPTIAVCGLLEVVQFQRGFRL